MVPDQAIGMGSWTGSCLSLSVPPISSFSPQPIPAPPPPPTGPHMLYYLAKPKSQDTDQRSHTFVLSTSAQQRKHLSSESSLVSSLAAQVAG